jgi:hypothetical protein
MHAVGYDAPALGGRGGLHRVHAAAAGEGGSSECKEWGEHLGIRLPVKYSAQL